MIELDGITECLEARKNGVKITVKGVGDFFIRRGGLSEWNRAVKEATEEVLSKSYSFNEIDPRQNEEITALACCNYTVSGWENVKDASEEDVPYSLVNAKNMLLAEANYQLVEYLVQQSNFGFNFLLSVVKEDAEQLKK